MSAVSTTNTIHGLPRSARALVIGTILLGAAVLLINFPTSEVNVPLFLGFALASSLASAVKVRLPLGAGSSNLSVSYTVDFASLLVLGPHPTMAVAAVSAMTQSAFGTSRRNALHRVLFSAAALVLTMAAAGWIFTALGGSAGVFDSQLIRPFVAAVLVYYMLNTAMMAAAIGLSTRQPVWRVWHNNFLWTAPSYFVGAGAAAAGVIAWTMNSGWLLPLVSAPLYLTFRSYRIYLDRLASEQRHNEEIRRLHAQSMEALCAAKESEQRYAMAAAGSNDGLWDWNLESDLFYVSDRWKLMIGLSADDRIDRSEQWFRDVHPEDLQGLRTALDQHVRGETPHFEHEYRMMHLDGTPRWVLCRGIAVRGPDGKPTRIAGSQTDVTVRRRVQDDLAHAALHDNLTGLANRTLFTAMLDRSLARARRSTDYMFAVLFVDLDHFKLVNDSLGHVAGDKFLIAMSRRFLKQMRPGDLLARLGGDEFAVLLDDLPDTATPGAVADRLQLALLEAFEIDGRDFYASASIGIAIGNSSYAKSEDLLRDADAAMYYAKAMGRARSQTFDPSMHASAVQRLTIETRLRRAVERRELSLEYQPVVRLGTEEVCGFEALVRWKHADGTATPPAEFIPVAEETGLIGPMTWWVLTESCRQVAKWQRASGRAIQLTVNISAKLFDRATLVQEVSEAIKDSGLLPGTLKLDITESFLANDAEAVIGRLEGFRAIPVELYLDDFGTGFSSLSYLHHYRLDALKIDGAFISQLGGEFSDAPIVTSIVNIARELGMGVIAEGVETPHQARQLRALKCPLAQGSHFSRPLTPEKAYRFLLDAPPGAQDADRTGMGDPWPRAVA
jgi:diguanylate cyclase (GGDEF)-like protein/PAS domain S-box-containing protein